MRVYPGPLARLIDELSRLPGIGPKSASRLAYHLLNAPPAVAHRLAGAIREARDTIGHCSVCQNLTDQDPCGICQDETRRRDVICVVEEPRDVVAMEKTRSYKGLYHVLLGALSPIEGIGPDKLTIRDLLGRLPNGVGEVILATNPNVEGDATALYLARLIKPLGIKVTRIARGLPVGAYLEYADEMTLNRAMEGRQEMR
ncbi:MAG: recombination mediator RecR [Peptococcaceae bacterium]|nr:recombination mediator RecR [Peptococcaceae bacterium]